MHDNAIARCEDVPDRATGRMPLSTYRLNEEKLNKLRVEFGETS